MKVLVKEEIQELLTEESEKIIQLLSLQQLQAVDKTGSMLEEIIDTQMYGLSCEVSYAIRIGAVGKDEGQKILSELEQEVTRFRNTEGEI